MSPREQQRHDRLRADVSRLLALMDHYEIVRHFKADWNVLDRAAEAFEHQVERVRVTLRDTKNEARSET